MTTINNNARLRYLIDTFNDDKNWKTIVLNSEGIRKGRMDIVNPKIVKNIDYDGNKELITNIYGSYYITENISRFLYFMLKFETEANIVLRFHDEIIIYKCNIVDYGTIINVDTVYDYFIKHYDTIRNQRLNDNKRREKQNKKYDEWFLIFFITMWLILIPWGIYLGYKKYHDI